MVIVCTDSHNLDDRTVTVYTPALSVGNGIVFGVVFTVSVLVAKPPAPSICIT